MKKSSAPAPILKQFAGLWTLAAQPANGRKDWSLEEKFRQAKKEGFEAIGGGVFPEAAALCEKFGFDYVCYTDGNARNFQDNLKAVQTTKPARVNVQLCDHDTPPKEAVRLWIRMEAAARKLGLEVDLEVHRDTCTETPEKTYEIAALFQKETGRKIRFSWDFSHLAVIKHIGAPYADRLLVRPDLVQLARQMHFRPFNGHHAQVPATDGKGHPSTEYPDFHAFIDAVLGCWFQGAKGGEVLYICPEFGPITGYGLQAFPNVWKDAVFVRGQTDELWKKHLRAWKRR